MNKNNTTSTAQIDPVAQTSVFFEQVVLSRTAELARAGRYQEAEMLLGSGKPIEDLNPQSLDMLARIYAQQRRYKEARTCWERAVEADPSGEAYRAALRRLTRIEAAPAWMPSRGFTFGFILLLALVILGFTVTNQHGGDALPLQLGPDLPGVTFTKGHKVTTIRFDSGLFMYGSRLKPGGRKLLTAVGKRLEPYGGVLIEIFGHTNNIPMPRGHDNRDNYALGLARAAVVVDHLRATTKLPRNAFSVRSQGEDRPLYPNDTRSNRARNMSVTIRVAPIGK